MARVLTGLQPSGQLHLGNWCGAIQQLLDLQQDHELYVFVASYHALTSSRNADDLREATRQVVIDYLAFGLDPERCHIYLQQDIPQVTELAWILSCVTPKHLMDKAVSYKDKVDKGIAANIGLFTYPILQAADILITDADIVPVGKDQIQHIEITRDIAGMVNHHWGNGGQDQLLKQPEPRLGEVPVVPGIDGQKMSKSYGNTIDPFLTGKPLRKRVMKIVTDSTPVEEPKDPTNCPVFQIFSAVAGAEATATQELAARYRAGGEGHGHFKQSLYELLEETFAEARERRADLMAKPALVDEVLASGAAAAQAVAQPVLDRLRTATGLR